MSLSGELVSESGQEPSASLQQPAIPIRAPGRAESGVQQDAGGATSSADKITSARAQSARDRPGARKIEWEDALVTVIVEG
ncbi:MAG TPA: hypothetical protein VIX13_04010 [Candidatus Eisenbacteria bacterium]